MTRTCIERRIMSNGRCSIPCGADGHRDRLAPKANAVLLLLLAFLLLGPYAKSYTKRESLWDLSLVESYGDCTRHMDVESGLLSLALPRPGACYPTG